ncbi:glycosyltransferase family 4 protein [Aeromonas salmonicida]|uniref:glycosyltransferase family 4 protein n=1 Tax=Aeromonas salmonicida TaxID=645 RepID=UPI0035A70E07
MKKIALFHPVDDMYGASNILVYTLALLSDTYACHVYVPKITGSMAQRLSEINKTKNVFFHELGDLPLVYRAMYTPKGIIEWVVKNIKLMMFLFKKRNEFTFFYVNTLSLFTIPLMVGLLGKKSLTHCHEYLAGSLYGKIIKYVIALSPTLVLSVSQHVDTYIKTRRNSSRYLVIHNGIPDSSQTMTVSNSDYLIGKINYALVGRVMPEKGHWFLLDTLEYMSESERKKIIVHIYGDAPPTRYHLMQDFKNEVNLRGLTDSIVIHGFDSNASQKIAFMDVCLVPSIMADPFPTTVLEATRCGRPVIATNHGGASEVINNEVNGLLIAPHDITSFANAINKLSNMSEVQRDSIGKMGRKNYEESFNINAYEKRFLNVVRSHILNGDVV